MSAMEPTTPVPGTARTDLPPERRMLVALLAALEGLLLVAAGVLEYLYRPQPVPVAGVSGGVPTGWTGYGCVQPAAPGGLPASSAFPCPPVDNTFQVALLIALVCAVAALLVLPAIIGVVSRRWQTALAAPSIPVWLALLVLVALSLVPGLGAYAGSVSGLPLGGIYPAALVVAATGPLLSALAVTASLGGLGWLARRAFAR